LLEVFMIAENIVPAPAKWKTSHGFE
jgi:hypothetical protein